MLSFADRLLMTLLYYRTCVTREFVGFLFGVDKGTVSQWRWSPGFRRSVAEDRLKPGLQQRPTAHPATASKGTGSRNEQGLGLCMAGVLRIAETTVRVDPDDLAAVFVNATEQPVHRPQRKLRRGYWGRSGTRSSTRWA